MRRRKKGREWSKKRIRKGSVKKTRKIERGSRATLLRTDEQERLNCTLHCLTNIAQSKMSSTGRI